MSQPIRILIADSDTDFATNLQQTLGCREDLQVVEIVRDGMGAVDRCKELCPDLVLMDLHLPVLDSIKTIQQIVAYNERVRILTTSAIPGDRYALEAVKAGACGYVEKNGDEETLVDTIRQVASGDVSLNPALAVSILEEFHRIAE
ncbi:MAG: response regulator transcription factor [Anaerolineae bacterium]|nr:response regulator transcription factor [Anaerolineae bacterium]